MLHIDEFVTDDQEAGIYTWRLEGDRLFGDTSIALLFGLDPEKTLKGLPLQVYLDRVHAEDQASLARAISDAVRGGRPYYAEYRVKNQIGQFVRVMAMGRCFRDEHDNPSFYSGIIYPLDLLP